MNPDASRDDDDDYPELSCPLERGGDQRKRGQKGTPTSGVDVPTGLFRIRVLNAKDSRK